MFGTAAIAHRFEPEPDVESVRCVRTGETFTVQYPEISQIDRDFARLANENIQRRTYAVMKGLA